MKQVNVKIKILLFISLFFLMCLSPILARKAIYIGTDYEISLFYNDTVFPGDAIIVTMQFSIPTNKQISANQNNINADLLFSNGLTGKIENKSSFYYIDKSKNILQAAIPLSTYAQNGDYTLNIKYTAFGNKEMAFLLPVYISKKDFESEKIPLNASNTAIKTDSSPERAKQIDRLNEILGTIDTSAVYQTSAFSMPIPEGTRRTSFFGDRRIYVYVNGKTETNLHYGIDFGIPTGTEVFACGSGKVVLTENRISTGYSVVIEHLPGLYSLYYHLDSYNVKEGDIISQGDKIGISGSTGLATGPHLHWEMRWNMVAVNPDFFTTNDIFTLK